MCSPRNLSMGRMGDSSQCRYILGFCIGLLITSHDKRNEGSSQMERIQHISKLLQDHPVRIIEPGDRAHAAVALILEERPSGLNVLFIERSSNEHDSWSGHIAFPGGRSESCDSGPRETAERETREELGLDLSTARYMGRLNDIAVDSLNIVVSCFVYAVTIRPDLHPDSREVAGTIWLPMSELQNQARRTQVVYISPNKKMWKFPGVRIFDREEKPLWGLTYRMLRNLNKVINHAENYKQNGDTPCSQ